MAKERAWPATDRAAVTAEDALRLRVAGATYAAIAAQLHISKTVAHRMVQRELAKSSEQRAELADQYRELLLQRTDRVLLSMMAKAQAGDTRAAAVLLRICEYQGKLLGLYSEVTQQQTINIQINGIDIERI